MSSRSSAASKMLTFVAVLDEMVSILLIPDRQWRFVRVEGGGGGGSGKSGSTCLFFAKTLRFYVPFELACSVMFF